MVDMDTSMDELMDELDTAKEDGCVTSCVSIQPARSTCMGGKCRCGCVWSTLRVHDGHSCISKSRAPCVVEQDGHYSATLMSADVDGQKRRIVMSSVEGC